MHNADFAGKAITANATGSETLIPNVSGGFANGAGVGRFDKNTGARRTRKYIHSVMSP